jgi:hypothetical protein
MKTIIEQNGAPTAERRQEIFFLGVTIFIAAAMLYLYGRIDYTRELFSVWDLHNYRAMGAAAPAIDPLVPRPFIYRMLGPFIAGAIPFDIDTSFYLLNIFCSLVLVSLLFLFTRRIGFEPQLAAAAAALYIFNKHFFGFTSWNYFHVNDVLMNIFIIWMFWSMLERRWLSFALATALASLTRETFLIMIPTAFVYLWEQKGTRAEYARASAAMLPGTALFILFRWMIPAGSGPTLIGAFLLYSEKVTRWYGIYYMFVNPFVPLTMAPLIFLDETIRFFRGRIYLLVFFGLVFFAALFGSNNERLLNPSFIVFYPLVAYIMRETFWRNRPLALAVIAGGFLSSLHYLVARHPLPSRNWTILLSGGTAVLLTLILAAYELRRRRSHLTG